LENSVSTPTEAHGFWVVDTLHTQRNEMPEGSVIFGGDLDVAGGNYSYQWQRPYNALVDSAMWAASFERLSALAHPVRGEIQHTLVHYPAPDSELIDEEIVTPHSTAYHHLSAPLHAGRIKKAGGEIFEVAPARVIPRKAIIAGSENH